VPTQHRARDDCDLPCNILWLSNLLQWCSRYRTLNEGSILESLSGHRRSNPARIDRIHAAFRRDADNLVLQLFGEDDQRSEGNFFVRALRSLTVGVRPYIRADFVAE
jgi:hypothetical protein